MNANHGGFEIELGMLARADSDVANISIRANGSVLTRVVDDTVTAGIQDGGTLRDYFRAPAVSLALWWAENWWRLRYEAYSGGLVPTVEWRLRHEITSAPGGVRWPPLMMYGEGERVVVAPRAGITEPGGPVRYLDIPVVSVDGRQYENGIDRFFEQVREMRATSDDFDALETILADLSRERLDPDLAGWRRMEAMLGFDPDDAPEELIVRLSAYEKQLGVAAVEEAATSYPGADSADVLAKTLEAVAASTIRLDRIVAKRLPSTATRPAGGISPWQLAETAAREMREAVGMPHGPIRAKSLADILGCRWTDLNDAQPTARQLPYAAVATERGNVDRCALQSDRGRSRQRRFEISRALGDAVWEPQGMFAPVSRAKTDRQKFQRAFAQSLLCPFSDLIAYIDTTSPTEKHVRDAAKHFHVSEGVVYTALVNKHVLPRERLEDRLEAA